MDNFGVLPDMDDFAFPYLSDDRLLEGRAEKLLAGEEPLESPAGGVKELQAVLSALRAPARPHEVDGQASAVAAFAAFSAAKEKAFAKEKAAAREKGNLRHLPTHFGPKVSAATAVALLALTGVAAAAVTGTLPARLQSFVHARIGAISGPANEPSRASSAPTTSARPTSAAHIPSAVAAKTEPTAVPAGGPSPDGASRAGLCHAFGVAKTWSFAATNSTATRNLEAAAAAAGQTMDEYCAPYLSGGKPPSKPSGKTGAPKPSNSQHGHGSENGNGSGGGGKGSGRANGGLSSSTNSKP